jgi:hypothetical protein
VATSLRLLRAFHFDSKDPEGETKIDCFGSRNHERIKDLAKQQKFVLTTFTT